MPVQTRRQEMPEQRLSDIERVSAREKLTGHNVTDKDLRGEVTISKEHIDNNKAVRDMLLKRGVKPEYLPSAKDLKKMQRGLDADDKKFMKDGGKRRGNDLHFKSNCYYRLLI